LPSGRMTYSSGQGKFSACGLAQGRFTILRMGMYTKMGIQVDLRKDTPKDVIETLNALVSGKDPSLLLTDKPKRWGYMFTNGSLVSLGNAGVQLSLLAAGEIKNYNNEIEAFFEWIMPYVDGMEGDFIGYTRYEDSDTTISVLLKDVPETPKPDSLGIRASIPLETILSAIEALALGIEFGREVLSTHDCALGRTIWRNRVAAEMMEADIEQMLQAHKALRSISEDSKQL